MDLLYQVTLLLAAIYLLSNTKLLYKAFNFKTLSLMDKLSLSLVFGVMGIIGTYTGIPYMGAIVNNRVIGVAVGGLIGGPLVGVLSGLIAGGHRFLIDIGGFTGLSCGISTIVEGLIAGLLSKMYLESKNKHIFSFLVGIFIESIQMFIILIIATPYADALKLVSSISIPMILVNSIGIMIMMSIYSELLKRHDLEGAYRSEQALQIASSCAKYLRKGLTKENAHSVALIIKTYSNVDAVELSDLSRTLSSVGFDPDQMHPGMPFPESVVRTLETGTTTVMKLKEKHLKKYSVITAPLLLDTELVGTLSLYVGNRNHIAKTDEKLANGLAQLFSTQLELSQLEHQKSLVHEAEIKLLQAKINPHFLFNSLNTIHSLIRSNPEKARELLVKFSEHFRNSIIGGECKVPLETELLHVSTYLELEQARFGENLAVEYLIDAPMDYVMPPLILQPLIENAINHGIFKSRKSGTVSVCAVEQTDSIEFRIVDDGVGIAPEIFDSLEGCCDTKHIGLKNTHKRIKASYPGNQGLMLELPEDGGTSIVFKIPKERLA